jgi:hypothetical protein
MHGHAVKLRLPQLTAGLDLLAHDQREALDDHSALIGRSAYLELDLLYGTADLPQQLALRRQIPLQAGDRVELLDQLAQYVAEGIQIVELGFQAVERLADSAAHRWPVAPTLGSIVDDRRLGRRRAGLRRWCHDHQHSGAVETSRSLRVPEV